MPNRVCVETPRAETLPLECGSQKTTLYSNEISTGLSPLGYGSVCLHFTLTYLNMRGEKRLCKYKKIMLKNY